MFRSARLKLTLFYLAVLLLFSLASTTTYRLFAQSQYDNSDSAQRSDVNHMLHGFAGFQTIPPRFDFDTMQDSQESLVRSRLVEEQIWINTVALVVGGLLSYWFAGITLKPIEDAHETQLRFASDASHELRTPLTNMKVENEVFLRQKQFTEDEARNLINSNLEEVQRLENLSSSLLELSRFDGQTELKLKVLAVEPIVSEAVKRVSKSAKAKKTTIVKQLPVAKIVGDRDSLLQLVAIVLDNAIKYGPEGGKVTVSGANDGEQYVVSVIDEGPGIDEADLPRIFDRLYRGDKARSNKINGYGLGLALAHEISKVNNMAITAQNNEGGGARFELHFNIAK